MALSKSAKYYRKNKSARDKKKKKDVAYMTSPKGLAYRASLKRARRKLDPPKDKDVAHTKNGFIIKSRKANRGSSTDQIGDVRSRGKKRK